MVSDEARAAAGFRTVAETAGLPGCVVYDPHSVLISRRVTIAAGNIFYPNVVIECDESSTLLIGAENTFWPGSLLLAAGGGNLRIGSQNTIGEGGARLKANHPGAAVAVGDRCRITGGADVVGVSTIGDGAQILGTISAQSVTLAGGGDFASADVDERGAVLKGFGLARSLTIARGDVVNGCGDFADAPVERQSAYH